jgi:hypothetical protein
MGQIGPKRFALTFGSAIAIVGAVLAAASSGCSTAKTPSSTYFERTISPVLTTSCVRTNTGAGCHVADDKGNSLGNLDVSTYAQLSKRRDLLLDYGPYGQPAFLVKNIAPFSVEVQSFDGTKATITTDIKHAGGSILDPTASGYQVLRRWLDNGATENNTGLTQATIDKLPCVTFVPSAPGFDPTVDPATPDFATFRDKVNPVLAQSCAAANCHGTQANDLYLTCGSAPDQIRWNYFSASDYVGKTPDQSEILRRPLAPSQGGSFHEGGVIFENASDSGYQAITDWATQKGPPDTSKLEPNFLFFTYRVQPMLVKKGCMMIQCHSASMFHDYRLRGGAGGSFSLSATRRNYDLSISQLNLESPDPSASRIVAKNLYRPDNCGVAGCDKAAGLLHRGGPLLEDFQQQAANPTLCDNAMPKYDYDKGDVDKIPAYCMILEWMRREQAALKLAPLSAIVYVARPPAPALRPQDFDVYTPGAELHLAKVTTSALGALTVGTDVSVNAACMLDKATADIRKPAVSWDGTKVAFAARSSATEPLAIYEMKSDGTACAKQAVINAGMPSGNGLLIHNFDPAYSAAGHLVFVSTRGNLKNDAYDYTGPQRTPADPTKPNSNLYVLDPDGKTIRQLTYLLNMERYPSFMVDGRVILTTEKREPNFYELALRRINIDGGDYHPLYSQRASLGYQQSTHVIELSNKNFAAIMNDPGAQGEGGALAVFNRSIGVDFTSTNPTDYPVDPTVIDPAAPASPEPGFFFHSLRFPDAAVSGHPGKPTNGLYASPSALPGGLILASFGAATDAASFGGDYDLYVVNPASGVKTKLLGAAGIAEIDGVGVYQRATRRVYLSAPDEPNGVTQIFPDKSEADITVLDFPVLASLLFQNTPTGRVVEDFDHVDVYEEMPPPTDLMSLDSGNANVATDAYGKVFVKRRLLGKVPLANDHSAHFQIPGGLPFVLHLPDTDTSSKASLPRYQREEMMFGQGEYVHQSFRRDFFDGLCANCHGSISGHAIDTALKPDMLTQASATTARGESPVNLNLPPGQRGSVEGPPASP